MVTLPQGREPGEGAGAVSGSIPAPWQGPARSMPTGEMHPGEVTTVVEAAAGEGYILREIRTISQALSAMLVEPAAGPVAGPAHPEHTNTVPIRW